jgi:hypothetical protein
MFGAVGFESDENKLRKLRERLRLMSDEELIRFGRSVRNLCRGKRCRLNPTRGLHNWRRQETNGGEGIRRFSTS